MSRLPPALSRDQRAESFSRAFGAAMRDLKISHRELADATGVSVHTVASWTRTDGPRVPAGENLQRLVYFLEQRRGGAGRALQAMLGESGDSGRARVAPPSSGPRALATTFVGREALVEEVLQAVQADRLVTLTGLGGVGKTRLAAQVASLAVIAFEDGAAMVELAPLSASAMVPMAIAAALDVRVPAGGDVMQAVARQYEHTCALIILDNCEHVLEGAVRAVEALLTRCPAVSVLTTTREPLHAPNERVIRVPQLGLPHAADGGTREELLRSDAARLFVTRAMHTRGAFKLGPGQIALVAGIVRRLDGLPLAIELAAASLAMMDLADVDARLADRFRLLVGPESTHSQHGTMRAAMDWSYELLSRAEQLLFAQLAVFRGGWTQDAAARVADARRLLTHEPVAALLARLFEKSLISVESADAVPRYQMLEIVREYALDQLARTPHAAETRLRHAEWCVGLAEEAEAGLKTEAQLAWLARLDAEHANVRAALAWLIDDKRDARMATRLVAALRTYWQRRAHYREGGDFAARVLGMPAIAALEPRLLGGAWLSAGVCAYYQAQYREAKSALEQALAAFERGADPVGGAHALNGLAQIAMYHDEYAQAESLASRALARFVAAGDAWGIATANSTLGYAIGRKLTTADNTVAMRDAFTRAVAGFEVCGDRFGLGAALNGLGGAALHIEDYAGAEGFYARSLALHRELDDQEWASRVLNNMGVCARGKGEFARAEAIFQEALAIRVRLGAMFGIATLRHNLGDALTMLGAYDRAFAHMRESVRLNLGYKDLHGLAQALLGVAAIWLAQGIRQADAARLLGFAGPPLGYPGAIAGGSDYLDMERKIDLARAALGDAVARQQMEAGAALDAQTAAEIALGAQP